MVRSGCKVIGFDHLDNNPRRRRNVVIIDATASKVDIIKNLENDSELRNDISALECHCNTDVLDTSLNLVEEENIDIRIDNFGSQCDEVSFDPDVSCMLFDLDNCQVWSWQQPISLGNGDSTSLIKTKGRKLYRKYHNRKISYDGSVIVKAGCFIDLFKGPYFNDKQVTFSAPMNENLQVRNLRKHKETKALDFVNSIRCYCMVQEV